MNRFIPLIIFVLCTVVAQSQNYTISGTVLNEKNKSAVEFAVVSLPDYDIWAVADEKGEFILKNIPQGKTTIVISNLGYKYTSFNILVQKDVLGLKYYLPESNLSLKEVEITAQRKRDDATTTYIIDKAALDHMQLINVSNISSLLPGGKTSTANSLISAERFSLRSNNGLASELGNPTFGSAVEVDGVRLSNNATFGDNNSGADTRNLSATNIESVEVVTGVPSVEYGDLSNGMIKVNTRKGKSPLAVEVVLQPKTKQYALNKGFQLGADGGVLNINVERAKSISDAASPYTSYDRNTLDLLYTKTFNRSGKQPLTLSAKIAGNIGGYNSETDPDLYKDTYTKKRDNVLRTSLSLEWLLNKPWITNAEVQGSFSYSDRLTTVQELKSTASAGLPSLHGTEEGYFVGKYYNDDPGAAIILIPAGTWYEKRYNSSKPVDYNLKAKAVWTRRFGVVRNKLLLGADYTRTGNEGRGTYYADYSLSPTWREYKYSDVPYMNNISLYAQEQASVRINGTDLQLTAGLRSDITSIKGSDYGTISGISPRFNLRYHIPLDKTSLFRDITIRGGYGEAVKLPSFQILYPTPTYVDRPVFAPGQYDGGKVYTAYYIEENKMSYNPNLKWQRDRLNEIGVDANIGGVKVSLAFFNNRTLNPYSYQTEALYTPFTYKFTSTKSLDEGNFPIPTSNRIYTLDPVTGIVTVSDKTGANPDQQLDYINVKTFKSKGVYNNATPITRRGLEWVVDFGKIPVLRTSFRVDGNYYYYKGINENILASAHSLTLTKVDESNKYIGYYAGTTNGPANGSLSKQLNTNLTITTHIPEVRLIVSLRVEASLYNYARNLSEYNGQQQAFVLDDKDSYFPSQTNKDIYAGNQFVGLYPLYYTSYDDMETKIPFAQAFADAKENNPELYAELARLVLKTNYNYTFNPQKISSYFSANLAITKEIGKYASLTFHAKNFFNNMSMVKNSWSDMNVSLYDSSYIPSFYYGLSLKITL